MIQKASVQAVSKVHCKLVGIIYSQSGNNGELIEASKKAPDTSRSILGYVEWVDSGGDANGDAGDKPVLC